MTGFVHSRNYLIPGQTVTEQEPVLRSVLGGKSCVHLGKSFEWNLGVFIPLTATRHKVVEDILADAFLQWKD